MSQSVFWLKHLVFLLALVGWGTMLLLHVATFRTDVEATWPEVRQQLVWVVPVVGLVAALEQWQRRPQGGPYTYRELRQTFGDTPTGLVWLLFGLIAYVFVQDFTMPAGLSGNDRVAPEAAGYVVRNRGNFIRQATAAEFAAFRSYELRHTSTFGLVVCTLGLATLYRYRPGTRPKAEEPEYAD